MGSARKLASRAMRWGVPGFVSGMLSCLLAQSFILYHEQKTVDHIAWPGLVFALVVLLPLSRWLGFGPLRTATALITSTAAYPIAWWIAARSTAATGGVMVGAFAFSGFLGSASLAGAVLPGGRRWLQSASATVVAGTLIGAGMGAYLLAALKRTDLPVSAGDALGVFLVLWQTVIAASLARAAESHSPEGGPPSPGRTDQPTNRKHTVEGLPK